MCTAVLFSWTGGIFFFLDRGLRYFRKFGPHVPRYFSGTFPVLSSTSYFKYFGVLLLKRHIQCIMVCIWRFSKSTEVPKVLKVPEKYHQVFVFLVCSNLHVDCLLSWNDVLSMDLIHEKIPHRVSEALSAAVLETPPDEPVDTRLCVPRYKSTAGTTTVLFPGPAVFFSFWTVDCGTFRNLDRRSPGTFPGLF